MKESLYAKQRGEGLISSRAAIRRRFAVRNCGEMSRCRARSEADTLIPLHGRMFRSGDGDSKPLWVGATPAGRARFSTFSLIAERPADYREIRVPFLGGGPSADGERVSSLAYIQ